MTKWEKFEEVLTGVSYSMASESSGTAADVRESLLEALDIVTNHLNHLYIQRARDARRR